MASKGKILHNKLRLEKATAAFDKRLAIKKELSNPELDFTTRVKLMLKLSQDRNASFTRYRRRCQLTGRPRGVIWGDLSRIAFRTLANQGKLPGIKKASW